MTTPEELKQYVRDVPDYPQKGIIFRDITPLLGEKKIFAEVVEMMSRSWVANPPDLVAAIEARGFIPGAAIAEPGMNPRASIPATRSGGSAAQGLDISSTTSAKILFSPSSGVMSRKMMPFCG